MLPKDYDNRRLECIMTKPKVGQAVVFPEICSTCDHPVPMAVIGDNGMPESFGEAHKFKNGKPISPNGFIVERDPQGVFRVTDSVADLIRGPAQVATKEY